MSALKAIYPEYQITRTNVKGFWQNKVNQRVFLDNIARSLNIQSPEDWYTVRSDTIMARGGSFINRYYNSSLIQGIEFYISSFFTALNTLYPEYKLQSFNRFTFAHNKRKGTAISKSQVTLCNVMKQFFPDSWIEQNFLYKVQNKTTKFEFDVSHLWIA